MGVASYYLAKQLIDGFGKMYFRKVFVEATSASGEPLLGSVVKETYDWSNVAFFPEPFQLTTPRLILTAIDARREALFIPPGPIVLVDSLAAYTGSITIDSKVSFQAGIDSLPNIPVTAGVTVDYGKMKSFTFDLGPNAQLKYVPTDYMSRLYRFVGGDSKLIDPHVAVRIDKNLIVDAVLIAKNFEYVFESSENLGADLKAKIDQANAQVGVEVSLTMVDETKIAAQIKDGKDYLIAFKTIEWHDLG
jgi:hypothetical protein